MVDPTLVDELALRTGVSRSDAEALLAALGQLAPERLPPPAQYLPDSREVQALIAAAEKHPLGIEFLLDGDLSSVAITFQVHAFSVDAARQHLKRHAL